VPVRSVSPSPCASASATGLSPGQLGVDGADFEALRRAAVDAAITAVCNLLGAQANPQNPSEVTVSQPSAALVATAGAQGAFNDLFPGLGAVALLVGAVGAANIMTISVLERRSGKGLRRALGATQGHIRVQFLAEAVLLAAIGGAADVGAAALSTAIYATARHEPVVIPRPRPGRLHRRGAVAGLWPAPRAARMSPTQALWSM
jgi:putative ABC transport system permease protein